MKNKNKFEQRYIKMKCQMYNHKEKIINENTQKKTSYLPPQKKRKIKLIANVFNYHSRN